MYSVGQFNAAQPVALSRRDLWIKKSAAAKKVGSARDGGADEGAARTTAAAEAAAGDKSGRNITGRVEHRCQAVKFLFRNLMKLDYRQRAADDLTYGPNNSRRANGPKLIVGRSIDSIVSPRVFDGPVSA